MTNKILLTRETLPPALRDIPLAVALGLFDGVHLAHQALIAAAAKRAADIHGALLVYTFDRNPLEVVAPLRAPKTLMPMPAKIKSINSAVRGNYLGILCTFVRQFSTLFAQLPPERFIRGLIETFKPAEVFVGYNYTFGAGGRGDVLLLRELGDTLGFSLNEMLPIRYGGEPISSSRIRREIANGNIELANAMLGRSFRIYGTLREGGGLTQLDKQIIPMDGKYSVLFRQEPKEIVIHLGKMEFTGTSHMGYTAIDVIQRIG